MKFRNLAWAFLVFAVISLALFAIGVFGLTPQSWDGWEKSDCWPGCFCEATWPGGVAQPLSVYSNLFYVLVGLLIIAAPAAPARNWMQRIPGHRVGYGLSIIAAGLTSWFYHVSLTQVGRWFDYMGMYAFAGYGLLYGAARVRGWSGKRFAIAYTMLLAVLGIWWITDPASKRILFGGLVAGLLLVEAYIHWKKKPQHIQTGYFFAALGCFLVGFAANMLDEARLICTPTSPWQWHAFWHFITALATGLLYLYYRSEDDTL